jgi:hypothetical protein
MSAPTNHGGSAFPALGPNYPYSEIGMTLRDYFAGQALNGFTVSSSANNEESIPLLMKMLAETSYLAADAMLLAREAKP